MTILQQPDALSLSQNLKDFHITSDVEVSFVLKQGDTEILSQRYDPSADGYITISLRDVVHARLSYQLVESGQAYQQLSLVSDFTAVVDDATTLNFRVIRGGVDRLADSAINFLTQNFLTWQPTIKPVTYYSPEFLTYYAVVACTAKLRAYFTDSAGSVTSQVDYTIAEMSAGIAYTMPLQYSVVAGWLGNKLPAYYDVWVENASGKRLTYIQRYHADDMRTEQEQWVLFENSLGGLDTFRAYGTTTFNGEHTHNLAEIAEVSQEYRVDTERKFQKNTGHLNQDERKWLLDFFPSQAKYLYVGNYLRQIVVTESNVNYTDRALPSNYTFTFKYADARPLLNLPRTDVPADVLNITVPSVGSFSVPPRLAEFPRLPLSEGALFPVQNPYSEEWGTTTAEAITNIVAALLSANFGAGGGVGHQHKNIDLLNLLSYFKDYLLVNGKKIKAGYADVAGEVEGDKYMRKDRPEVMKYLLNLLAGLKVNNGITSDTIIVTESIFGKNIKASEEVSGKNLTASDKMTTKDLDITNIATMLRGILKGNLSSETFISGLLGTGWNVTPEGDIEARSLLLRAFLEVPELRYNKITVIGSEFWVSEGGIIMDVEEAGGNQYKVTLKLEEGDTNPFATDDILRGIYHHNKGFRTVMFRVISVSEDDTMLVMPQLADVIPCKFMNIARMGNFTNVERQRSIYLSGREGYVRFLDGVNSWEVAPAMVAMQLGNTKGFVHPTFGDMSGYSALLENIFMTGSIRVISADGVTAKRVPVDKGAHEAGKRYYEYDRVSYAGSLYLCIAKETTAMPGASSVDWLKEVSKGDTGAQGPAGAKGATGATGPTGSQGIPGISQYFHVKYSAAANGNPMVDTPNTYIGTAVTSSATAPTTYSSYKWVRMEGAQGPQGTQGIAGPKGSDGRTTYLHIKYSDNGTSFTANGGETPGAYIGQYTDFTAADSNTFSAYTWTKVKGETGAQGPAGAKGATGATGPTGSQGIPGTSQYFHVKYSAAANGNPMVDTPNTYIGTAVTSSATAPTTYSSYKWVQLKGSQGPQGTQGIAGTKGADGRTPYLHIKYSDNGTSFTANSGETPGAYIGQYTDFTAADSMTFSAYTWSKIKGDTGPKGATGATGPAGAKGATGATGPTGSQGIPGTSQYFHVKYSANANGNPMVDTPNTYIGTAVTSSATAPTTYSSYKWVQLKGSQGPQGTQGIAGTKGADGRTPYLHIKYSDNGTSFTANSGETPGAYIGQYTDFTAADSMTFSAYTWSKIKGDTGPKGATGATGPAGAKGATGATGPTGSQGIPGTSQYFHIRYSAASNGNPMVTTPNTYIGTAVTTSATAPTAYTSYKWAQFKGSQGPQGTQGIAGTKGADGRTPYLHIKYSDNGTSFTGNSGETPGAYIGQYTDFTAADSMTFSAYTWSKIKGETGPAGAKGAVGQVGPVGPIGPKGATGAAGAKGATGATGPTGPVGPKGATGATGPKGDKGDAIASSYMNGVMKYADPYFRTSANSTGLYNNSGGSAGIWERLAKPAGVPGPSGYYMRYRYVGGTTSPGLGGFSFSTPTYRNCEFIARIIAKFPAGYTINYAANSQGNSPISQWLTPNVGTGAYTEYVYRVKCSDAGTFSTGMYFYFSGAAKAFTAEVAYATVFDTVANDRTTYIDSNGVYTGTLTARQITATNVVFGTANIGDGTITNAKIASLDAGKISTGYLSAARIAALAITSDKIAANAITAAKIAAGTITSDKINVTSIRAAVLTADAIAALTITTGKLTVTNGAKIGGWSVIGNNLSCNSAAGAKILLEPSGTRFLRINESTSKLMSIRADGVTGVSIYTQDTTGKCLSLSAQTGGTSIESYGSHTFGQRDGEKWNAPGVLWAGRINSGGRIENYWGNGCTVSTSRFAVGQYRINHNLNHTQYYAYITSTPWTTEGGKWVFGMITEVYSTYFNVFLVDSNQGAKDTSFNLMIVGRNKF